MGYFSNGTEGEMYQNRWCDNCIHNKEDNCRVWFAHQLYNYDECNNDKSILPLLIPRTKDGLDNEQCLMFVETQQGEKAPAPTEPQSEET